MIRPDEIRAARERIGDTVLRTPLVRFDERISLKLECLQPIGSFKLRGALNAMRAQPAQDVLTASAGNMAQGVAWAARELGVRATVVAPETAPRAKLDRVEELGARVVLVPHERWWQAMVERRYEGVDALFVHPVEDELVIAGNGTIGLELLEDGGFDTVVVPWGGGGLTSGIASAVREHGIRVVAAEPETAAPLAAAFRAGRPTEIEYEPSFVDGAGGRALLPTMWERARALVDEAVAVPLADVEEAMRLLAVRAHVVAEGAGALALAVALRRADRCACIVSGGNVDADVYARILGG
ncbi:MAG TPA: pyridoxal-phosphate dependent enzyme [Gaiellaceae bacterium]|nr:pyridoxal-phosphate dependent enzyme [Gaiellaceae bacterium]